MAVLYSVCNQFFQEVLANVVFAYITTDIVITYLKIFLYFWLILLLIELQ